MRFLLFFRRRTAVAAMVAVCAFGLFGLQGCATVKKMTEGEEPAAEVVLQSPPSYGVVTNVTPAAFLDREIHRGDIAITVDLEDGRVVTVVQPEDDTYVVGDRVRVIRSGEKFSRVQMY